MKRGGHVGKKDKKKKDKTKKKEFKVFRSTIGLGLQSLSDIKKGEEMLDYLGELITDDEANRRANRYLFRLDEGYNLDGSIRSNIARYINHSCAPNAQAVHHEEDRRIVIEAIKRIRPGDEITINYGEEYFDEYIRPIGCKCVKCKPA